MYIRSKKVLCASLAAAMILLSGTAAVRADKSLDAASVGIISKVDKYIELNGDRAVEDLTGTVLQAEAAETKEEVKKAPAKKEETKKKAEYAQFDGKAVAIVETELNIRKDKNEEAETVGVLRRFGICDVKEKGDKWTEIESGSCKGYVKTEYLKFGDDAAKWYLDNGYNEVVTVNTDTLTLRGDADIESECLGMVGRGETYDILERGKEWTKIQVDDELQGYVNNKYIEIGFQTVKAVSNDELQAALRAEEEKAEEKNDETEGKSEEDKINEDSEEKDAAPDNEEDKENAEEADDEASEDTDESEDEDSEDEEESEDEEDSEDEEESEDEDESDEEESDEDEDESDEEDTEESEEESSEEETTEEQSYAAPAGQEGQDIVNYALQFVGNPYVWGGTSLTNGADCSGFVQTIYADFGYSIPRCADDQAFVGTQVSLSELQPGDLLFYGDDSIGHVAMYIGNGNIVHAAGSSQGIITQNYDYHTPCRAVRIVNQ